MYAHSMQFLLFTFSDLTMCTELYQLHFALHALRHVPCTWYITWYVHMYTCTFYTCTWYTCTYVELFVVIVTEL